MDKQHVIKLIEELKSKYSTKTSKVLERLSKAVDIGDAQATTTDAVLASRYEAKVDALEELLEKLEEEE